MNKTYENIILAIRDTQIWPNHLKPGLLAWSIGEQGRGVGELAIHALNYYSLHYRANLSDSYPNYYLLPDTDEIDRKYFKFSSAEQCLEALYKFIHRPYYYIKGNPDDHMTSIEDLLRHITPAFCPRKDYVEYILGLVPEAETELRKVGWKPEEEPVPEPEVEKYSIRNGLLYFGNNTVPYFESPNKDKWIKNIPRFIILHYTASLGVSGNINWFINPKSRVSPHLFISRTGTIIQFVPFHVPAWHSGSTYYNRIGIGIELEGLGCSRIRIGGNVVFTKWNGVNLVPVEDCVYAPHPLEPKTWRYWPKFAEAQYNAMNMILPGLREYYGGLKIQEHWQIVSGKLDCGPGLDKKRLGVI